MKFGAWVARAVTCVPKNFTLIACMASQEWPIKYSIFRNFAVPVAIQSIVTWELFIILKNELHHCQAQRISFHLVYLTA